MTAALSERVDALGIDNVVYAGTPAGQYSLRYRICEVESPITLLTAIPPDRVSTSTLAARQAIASVGSYSLGYRMLLIPVSFTASIPVATTAAGMVVREETAVD